MNELHFGVCIGIDRYPGFPGRDLGSARGDAAAFRDWLLAGDGGGLPPDNVAFVTASPADVWASAGDARPQAREVNNALHGFNRRLRAHLDANPGDFEQTRLYLYAAGHGIGPPDAECAILLADADPDLLGNNIELSRYRDWYRRCALFHELVIFADCCREIAAGVPPANAPPFTVCNDPAPPATTYFAGYATRLGGTAWEPIAPAERDRARGYYTAALLEGLGGAALDAASGTVTSTTLAQYVEQVVEARTAVTAPFPQQAEHPGLLGAPIRFGAPGGRPHRRVTIRFPATVSGEVVLRSSPTAEIGRWDSGGGPWVIDLPDGFYEVVPAAAVADAAAVGAAVAAGAAAEPTDWLFKVVGDDVDVRL